MPSKLCAYVDESWYGSRSDSLIVAVVVVKGDETEHHRQLCEEVERQVGKSSKWSKTSPEVRRTYLQRVLAHPSFRAKLYYAVYSPGEEYQQRVARCIAAALTATADQGYRATVRIDALSRRDETKVKRHLHALGAGVKKVRGVRKDENDALIRLADAVCGWVRATIDGDTGLGDLLHAAVTKGMIMPLETGKK